MSTIDRAPPAAEGPQFIVGQDERGRWVALDTHRGSGGLFRSRGAALRFAAFETRHRPGGFAVATTPVRLPF